MATAVFMACLCLVLLGQIMGGRQNSPSGNVESDEEFDRRWVTYFSRPDIDAWELRKGLNDLYGHDLVPEPKIIIAVLHACRRLDDFASTARVLELMKQKAMGSPNIYEYVLREIQPTLNELGISTPEELGLD